jgi:uncharacterized protein (TIGR03435 family)
MKVVRIALLAPLVAAGAMRASPTQNSQRPQFAAASIKPSEATATLLNGVELKFLPGRFTARNAELRDLIVAAYRLPYWRIVVGPGSATSDIKAATDRYNIEATAEEKVSSDQLRLMLQNLLVDRFKLAVHRDFKPDQDVYNLVVAKNGPKFQEVKVEAYTGSRRAGRGRLTTEQMKMADLAVWLEGEVETSVHDKTGLAGIYKFDLVFTPEALRITSSAPPQLHVSGDRPIDPTHTSLSWALQEELGLRLKAVKGPLEILVIDHAERPSEN